MTNETEDTTYYCVVPVYLDGGRPFQQEDGSTLYRDRKHAEDELTGALRSIDRVGNLPFTYRLAKVVLLEDEERNEG